MQSLNDTIVKEIEELGVKAIGINGKDGAREPIWRVQMSVFDYKARTKEGEEVDFIIQQNKINGKFSVFSGYAKGINLKLIPGKKIVQKWHGADWVEGIYSKATFSLKPVKSGTKLTFTQTGVPQEHRKSISEGWHEHYWEPMKEMLEK